MENTEGKITPGASMPVPVPVLVLVLVSTLFLGGVLFVIGYVCSRLSRSDRSSHSAKNAAESEKVKLDYTKSESASGSAATTGSNKRAKNKKRREAQQEFTHSWLRGALKGHTATVLDINFSSNGKYLASCAEDCGMLLGARMLEPGKQYECKRNQALAKTTTSAGNKSSSRISATTTMTTTSSPDARSSGAIVAQSRSPSSSPSASQSTKDDRGANLSRRQRKNRTKNPREQRREPHDDERPHHRQHHHHRQIVRLPAPSYQVFQTQWEYKRKVANGAAPEGFLSDLRKDLWQLTDANLASILRSYTLTEDHLARLGYPMQCTYYPGSVMIINHFPLRQHRQTTRQHHHLDANAQEFVPSSGNSSTTTESEADSGNSSGSSDLEQESCSDSDKNSDNGESTCSSDFACQEASRRNSAVELAGIGHEQGAGTLSYIVERKCARCEKLFYVNHEDGSYVTEDQCTYHWGKLRNEGANYMQNRVWDCCRGQYDEPGCTTASMHVWTGLAPGFNGPFYDYVSTQASAVDPDDGNYGVYALDCEMCFTRRGLDLVKVSVVDMCGYVMYDTLVKPDDQVIDYNTKFSGITANDLANVTKTLRDVQKDLTSFIHAQTILVGHALENDLRALRLIHKTIVDTCVIYPHYLGFPFRSSLKTLARVLLRKDIQVPRHDSVEDARTVVDLILKKVQYHISENH